MESIEPVYLEIVIDSRELTAASSSRDDLEEPLEVALAEGKLGVVCGGGSSSQTVIIEVEIYDGERLKEALAVLRRTLIDHRAPSGTVIKQTEPERRIFTLNG
jgi:hypothetical protein